MNVPAFQTVSVTCPQCHTPFSTPILTLIDTAQNPDAKVLLLSGQLNIAVCPQCGRGGALATPLVYHDPDKQLLLVHMPAELGLPESEQQRIIGDLTNRLMSSMAAEKRKAYLLQPRIFLRLEGMLDAILEADGITPEMLEAQRARITVLNELMRATSDETRQIIAQEHDGEIDYQFFQLLTFNLEAAQAEGQEEMAQQLLELRRQLLEWTTTGKEAAARNEAIKSLGPDVTREELLDKVVTAALAGENVKVEAMVSVARPVVDYVFYQQLTDRIEAATKAGDTGRAETLKSLRESILDLTAQIDAEIQKATARASKFLQDVTESDDMEATIRANVEQVDDMFLSVLATNLSMAEDTGRAETVEKLRRISDIIMKLIQESQPSEVLLINDLLSAEYPDGTQQLLAENPEMVTPALLEFMEIVGEDLAENGQEETAERLARIAAQAAKMIEDNPETTG